MTKLTPKNIEGTIANNKIIKKLNDGSFAEVTQVDITALGFSVGGGGGPVDGLDGIVFSNTSMEFKANYRGSSLGTWGELGAGCWYDNINKHIYVSNDNNIKKYNISGLLLSTIATSGVKGMIKGSNTNRILFTLNGTQKIDLDTNVVTGGGLGTTLDVSPSGDFVISAITNTGSQFSIRKYDTSTLSTISTYTYTYPVSGNANNGFGGATMINDSTIAILIHDGLGLSVGTAKVITVNIDTSTIVNTYIFTYPGGPIAINGIQYSTYDNLIYYKEYIGLRSISTSLVGVSVVTPPAGTNRSYFQIYRCSDGSIGTLAQSTGSPLDFTSALVVNASSKGWTTFSFTTSQSSQLTPIY